MSKQFLRMAFCAAILCCGCARDRARLTKMLPPLPAIPNLPALPTRLRISQATSPEDTQTLQVGSETIQPALLRDHEFESQAARLNVAGEDHVRQMAALGDVAWTIIIEPAFSLADPETPGASDQLLRMRRQIVVQKLLSLGVVDAERRVKIRSEFQHEVTPQLSENISEY